MNKEEFRNEQREILTKYGNTEEKKAEDLVLLKKLGKLDLIKNVQSIGITASLPLEVDTSEIIAHLWDLGKMVYLARVIPGSAHKMEMVRYTYRTKLKRSKFGVEEVADPNSEVNNDLDLIIVPGLAFSLDQHERLGFGGGYYDRFLAEHHDSQTLALANSKMIFKQTEWPVESTDIPIDYILTIGN